MTAIGDEGLNALTPADIAAYGTLCLLAYAQAVSIDENLCKMELTTQFPDLADSIARILDAFELVERVTIANGADVAAFYLKERDTFVFAVDGTDFHRFPECLIEARSDLSNCLSVAFGRSVRQAIAVSAFLQKFREKIGNAKLICCGHSLGGHIVQKLALFDPECMHTGVTFNAPGISFMDFRSRSLLGQLNKNGWVPPIVNFAAHEPIARFGTPVGKRIFVPGMRSHRLADLLMMMSQGDT